MCGKVLYHIGPSILFAMKQLTNRKLYDTDKSDRIAQYCPIPDKGDYDFIKEKPHETEGGEYFLAAKGGPRLKWAEEYGAYHPDSEEIGGSIQ
jgi:hypothetical protein